jgi:hypothetical protein
MKRSGIYYDPDYRKSPVDLVNHCCRCQKSLNGKKAIPVTINENTLYLLEGHNAKFEDERQDMIVNAYIGADCLKTIKAIAKAEAV